MIAAALADLGAGVEPLQRLAAALPESLEGVKKAEVRLEKVTRAGVEAAAVRLELVEEDVDRWFQDFYEALLKLKAKLGLSEYVYGKARKVLELLEEAEKRVHGGREGHLHELGSADTLFDAVAAPLLVEHAGLLGCKVLSTPVAVGRGSVKIEHGVVSVPAPAARRVLALRGIPFRIGPVDGELATPTGLAVLAALVDEFVEETPPARILRLGYGAGWRDYGTQPLSIAEVELGEQLQSDLVAVLETNVDDADGELLAYVRELALERGALDFYAIPATGKKGRPAFLVQVIAEPEHALELARLLMLELGTLGVRVQKVGRVKLRREIRGVEVEGGRVRVKVAYDEKGEVVRVKPEHADLERIARKTGKSLRLLREEVQGALQRGSAVETVRATGQPRAGAESEASSESGC
jgi:uncharacterized protein (TIGR00299 family) protein